MKKNKNPFTEGDVVICNLPNKKMSFSVNLTYGKRYGVICSLPDGIVLKDDTGEKRLFVYTLFGFKRKKLVSSYFVSK